MLEWGGRKGLQIISLGGYFKRDPAPLRLGISCTVEISMVVQSWSDGLNLNLVY